LTDLATLSPDAQLFADLVVTALQAERELRPFVGELAPDPSFARNWGGWREIPHPSRILAERSEMGLRLGELYDVMLEKDTGLAGLWEKRVKAVLALPRVIRPADSSPLAQETAAFARAARRLVPLQIVTIGHYLSAIPKGVAITEILWELQSRGPLAGAWLPVDLIDRPMWRFAWGAEDRALRIVGDRLRQSFVAPPMKFAVLSAGTKDNPWGKALLDRLYWIWYLKKHASKYWALFVERFAAPLTRGTYRHRANDEKANAESQGKLLQILETLRTGSSVVLPEGLEVGFLEASRGGDASYGSFLGWLDRAEALILLGEVDTSGLAKGPGSFAKSSVSNEVRLETVSHDAHLLGSWETDTLLRWLTLINFGPDAPVPAAVYDAMDAGDRSLRMQGIEATLDEGLAVPRSYFFMTMQVPDSLDGEDVVQRTTTADAPPALRDPAGRVHLADDPPDDDLSDVGAVIEARDAQLQAVADFFSPAMTAYFEAHRTRLVQLLAEPDAADVLDRLVAGDTPSAFVDALTAAQLHGAGWSLWHVREDLGSIRLASPDDWSSATTPSTVIEFWAALLGVSKDFFLTLSDAARRLAFAVAGLAEGPLLTELHHILGQAQAGGRDRATATAEILRAYEAHGLVPTSNHHAQLVYANNTRQAAHAIRYQQTVGNPAARRLIPYLVWWTIGDDRVRERPNHDHAVMHGRVFATDHRIWQTWWPIAGHNCRCGVGTINVAEARRRGYVGSEPTGPWPVAPATGGPALPDPGFRSAPDLLRAAQDLRNRTQTIYDEAQTEGGDLLAAIRRLFGALGLLPPEDQ
jgi:phage gp29-like protein